MTRLHLTSVIFLAMVLSCAQPQEQQATSEVTGSENNPNWENDIRIGSTFLNAILTQDLEEAQEMMADNFISFGPAPGEQRNADEYAAFWENNYDNYSVMEVDKVHYSFRIVQDENPDFVGDWVFTWGNYKAEHASGVEVNVPFHNRIKVNDGKVEAIHNYYDRLSLYQTIGYQVIAPEDQTAGN